jgi:hypothetical protein
MAHAGGTEAAMGDKLVRLGVTVAALFAFYAPAAARFVDQVEACLRVELERLEEVYDLLDTYAARIWPGWNNYLNVEFEVLFPNLTRLFVNPTAPLHDDYKAVDGVTVRNRKVYVSRANEVPLAITPPLARGGNARGGRVYIKLESLGEVLPPEAFGRANSAEYREARSEVQILTYVHELFHEYQSEVWPSRRDAVKRQKALRAKQAPAARPSVARRLDRADQPPIFIVPLEFAVHKEIEGRALLAAYASGRMGRRWST